MGIFCRVPRLGNFTISSFLHQGTLRTPLQAKDYSIVYRAQSFPVTVVINYMEITLVVSPITTMGLAGPKGVFEERIFLPSMPQVGDTVQAEVIKLEQGRMEFGVMWQNQEVKYYLPHELKDIETTGHALEEHRLWVRCVRNSNINVGTIPQKLKNLNEDLLVGTND